MRYSQTIDFSCRRRLTFKEVFRHSSCFPCHLSVCVCLFVFLCVWVPVWIWRLLQLHRDAMASLCLTWLVLRDVRQVFWKVYAILLLYVYCRFCLWTVYNAIYYMLVIIFMYELKYGAHLLLIYYANHISYHQIKNKNHQNFIFK